MTQKHPKGRHNRLKAEDAAREKANPTENIEDKHMARPKSSDQIASNEAMRRKVAEQHQADPARRETSDQVQQRKQTDSDQAERTRREGPSPDPQAEQHQRTDSPAVKADDAFGQRKTDEDPKIGAAGREPFRNREAPNDFKSVERPVDMHGMQAEVNEGPKASKDQKPTAEFNIAVALHPELLDTNREGRRELPADKHMFISDDLAAELSSKFAHHEIVYTDSGIDVRSGGESISLDKGWVGKCNSRADLRAYIDSLPVVRHG